MGTSNNRIIEELATTTLKAALLQCPLLGSNISSNDRTLSWDGEVFVYSNERQKVEDLYGRVPIQVKGTQKKLASDTASFSCELTHLRNYYNDGGCVFFLVSVSPLTSVSSIYYSSLMVYDLKKIIDQAERQKSYTIRLDRFPVDDINEIMAIFLGFIEDSRKQSSFIGKDLFSLEQLENNGAEIESISFSVPGAGDTPHELGEYLATHEFFIYAKPKGLDIEIPIEKVKDAIISRTVHGKVVVKGVEYFPSYLVVHQKESSFLKIGKGIRLYIDLSNQSIRINYTSEGTLSERIADASCYIAAIENEEIIVNGAQIPLTVNDDKKRQILKNKIQEYKNTLKRLRDVKQMLDYFGVTEELDPAALSLKDNIKIKNFVNAILYDKSIGFSESNEPVIYGGFKLANLSIWIWATKLPDGNYKLTNFFDSHPIAVFEEEDRTCSNPIPASHYLLLNKKAFISASNMRIEAVRESICALEYNPLLVDYVTNLLLNILRGYDEKKQKDSQLLDLADAICDWLLNSEGETASIVLNKLQIVKRRRSLTTNEIIQLSKFTGDDNPNMIRCGAFLLLDDSKEAQKYFDLLSPEDQDVFVTFPICRFGCIESTEHQKCKTDNISEGEAQS